MHRVALTPNAIVVIIAAIHLCYYLVTPRRRRRSCRGRRRLGRRRLHSTGPDRFRLRLTMGEVEPISPSRILKVRAPGNH